MSFYQNYTFKATGVALTGVADFTSSAVGTVFEKKSGELFTKNTQGLFEKTARVVPSLTDVNSVVSAHEANTTFHHQNNITNVNPTATSGSNAGYSVGSLWINTTTNTVFTCTNATPFAAVWVEDVKTSDKGIPNGVATLDNFGNPVQGVNARNGKCISLGTGYDLNSIDIDRPSGIYDGFNLTNAPAIGWLYIELVKHASWTTTNRWATVKATTFGSGNTANLVYERAISSGVWGQWIKIQTSADRGVANGLATLDAAGSLVQMPTAAQVGLGNVNNTSDVNKPVSTAQQAALNGKENVSVGGGVSFPQHGLAANNGTASTLPVDTALGAMSVTYPSGLYEVSLTVAQLGLPAGWWYIDYKRHSSDTAANRYYSIMAYPLTPTANLVYNFHMVNNVPNGFTRVDATAQARADAAYTLASSAGTNITTITTFPFTLGVIYLSGKFGSTVSATAVSAIGGGYKHIYLKTQDPTTTIYTTVVNIVAYNNGAWSTYGNLNSYVPPNTYFMLSTNISTGAITGPVITSYD